MAFPYKTVLMVGASSGIGRAMASRILEQNPGSHIIAVGRRTELLQSLQQEHGAERVSVETCDIADIEGLGAFVERVTAAYPALDCVFLNAGIHCDFDFAHPGSFAMSSFDAELRTNLTAPTHLTHLLLPFLLASARRTALVYVTSCLAVVPSARSPGYSASKAALHAFALSLRQQLAHQPAVRVIELMPPAVQTEPHRAEQQPGPKHGGKAGMPLAQFTDQAYAGLVEAAGEAELGGKEKMAREKVLVGGFPGIREMEEWREGWVEKVWAAMPPEGRAGKAE